MNRIGHDEQPEQRDEPDQLAERDRARRRPARSRPRAGAPSRAPAARRAPPRTWRGCSPPSTRSSRSASACIGEPLGLGVLAPEGLDDERAVDRLVRDRGDLADVLLRARGRLLHPLGEAPVHQRERREQRAPDRARATGRRASIWIIASTHQHDHAGRERHRPEHVDRRLHVGLHVREQLAGRRLAVVLERELAVPVRRPRRSVAMTRSPATPQ